MVFVEICVGSSCHLKGAPEIVSMIEAAVAENHLEDDVVLSGSFCTGKCNRIGVTVSVNNEIYTGITKENFREFFEERIKKPVLAERGA